MCTLTVPHPFGYILSDFIQVCGNSMTFLNKKSQSKPPSPSLLDSILLAVLTVSPKRQYLGILIPTTPAQAGPERKMNLVHFHCFSFELFAKLQPQKWVI